MSGYGFRDWDEFLKKYIEGYTDFNWEDVRNNISILPAEELNNILKLYASDFDIDMHQLRVKKEKEIEEYERREEERKKEYIADQDKMEYNTYQKKFLDERFPQYRYRYDILQKKGYYYLPEDLRSFMHTYYDRGECKDKDRYRRPYDMKCVKPCKKGKDNVFTKKGCVNVSCKDGWVYDYIKGKCRALYTKKEHRTLYAVIITLLTNYREGSVDIIRKDNDPVQFDFKFMDDDESIYFKYISEIPDKDFVYYGKIKGNRMTPDILIKTFNMILKLYFTNFYIVAVKNNFRYIMNTMYRGFDWKKFMYDDTKVFYDTLFPPQRASGVKGNVQNELLKYVKGKNKRLEMDIYIMDGYARYLYNKYNEYFDDNDDKKIFNNVYWRGFEGSGLSYFAFTDPYRMTDQQLNKLMLGLLKVPIAELKMEHRRYKKGVKHMRTTIMNLLNITKKNLDDDKKRFIDKHNQAIKDMCGDGKEINYNTGKCRKECPKETHDRNAADRCVKKCKKGYKRIDGKGRCKKQE